MAHYMMLARFTKKGIESLEATEERIHKFKALCTKEGAKVVSFYLLLGEYDIACFIDAPNTEVIAKIAMLVGMRGNVRTESMPAFTEGEFVNMVKKLTA